MVILPLEIIHVNIVITVSTCMYLFSSEVRKKYRSFN